MADSLTICVSLHSVPGVFTGYFIKRFGAQRVGVFATAIAVLGLFTGALVDHIYYLYASFGVMFGKYRV